MSENARFSSIDVLILAGGMGKRLSSVVSDVPKPMAPIGDKPFLEILLRQLKKHGLISIVILAGYKSEVIINYFGDGSKCGIDISYSLEDSPLGTGGAIRKAILNSSADYFLVLNGDTFFDINYIDFIKLAMKSNAIALRRVDNSDRYGRVEVDFSDNSIKCFHEKQVNLSISSAGFINAGVYYLCRDIVQYIPDGFSSLEKDVFEKHFMSAKLKAFSFENNFIDIGIPDDYAIAQKCLHKWISESTITILI